MMVGSRIGIAACLLAVASLQGAPVADSGQWFRVSFEPVPKKVESSVVLSPQPLLEQPMSEPAATHQETQVPAPVRNLRRADR